MANPLPMAPLRVLSLFDGISCGQLALRRVGVRDYEYFASEIDPGAIAITMRRFPDTIQLGDVRTVSAPPGRRIDILMGGSPCQGLSQSGKKLGLNDPRSRLFFEFLRLLKSARPRYFLLENVPMPRSIQDDISNLLGCEPIEIDSAAFCAQRRVRLYWTNLPLPAKRSKPSDRVLADVIGKQVPASVVRSPKPMYLYNIFENGGQNGNVFSPYGKCPPLLSGTTPRVDLGGGKHRKVTAEECEKLQTVPVGYTRELSSTRRIFHLGNGWTVDVIAHLLRPLLTK